MRWEDLEVVLELKQPADAFVLCLRALGPAEVGPADVADEQRVAAQDDRRHRAARRVGHQQTDRLGAVARCMDDLDKELPQMDDLTVFQSFYGVTDVSRLMEPDSCACLFGQRSVT